MHASATSWQSSRMERMASSFAGMMKSSSSGSTFVSPVPTTGISSLFASVTAMRSRCGSTMKMMPGRRLILRMPPSVAWSLPSSSMCLAASFFVIRSKSPAICRASSWSISPMRFLMVTKLVSMPPSQRLVTYGWPARTASCITGSWACFFVPTKSTLSPRATVSVM